MERRLVQQHTLDLQGLALGPYAIVTALKFVDDVWLFCEQLVFPHPRSERRRAFYLHK